MLAIAICGRFREVASGTPRRIQARWMYGVAGVACVPLRSSSASARSWGPPGGLQLEAGMCARREAREANGRAVGIERRRVDCGSGRASCRAP